MNPLSGTTVWVIPPPLHESRIPRVGENWRGTVHGSLYHVLAVEEVQEEYGWRTWVTYLVMHQGNPYWAERYPPGSVCRQFLEAWLSLLDYAPEWNR